MKSAGPEKSVTRVRLCDLVVQSAASTSLVVARHRRLLCLEDLRCGGCSVTSPFQRCQYANRTRLAVVGIAPRSLQLGKRKIRRFGRRRMQLCARWQVKLGWEQSAACAHLPWGYSCDYIRLSCTRASIAVVGIPVSLLRTGQACACRFCTAPLHQRPHACAIDTIHLSPTRLVHG
jgi:hypothetical protein